MNGTRAVQSLLFALFMTIAMAWHYGIFHHPDLNLAAAFLLSAGLFAVHTVGFYFASLLVDTLISRWTGKATR